MAVDRISIKIEDNDDLTAAYAAASATGVPVQAVTPPPSGDLEAQIEPVTAVLIGAGVVAAVKLILDWWERRKGGLVIDLRKDATDMFYRDKDLTYGFVATIPEKGGKVTVDVKDLPDAATTWINLVITSAFKTVQDAAKAAKAAVGDSKVSVEPAAAG
ncbi:MAG TPA: hypothetical protein PLL50_09485 [Propionicimonas sp.]|nr:hypothetical protein [Propionicimonas sp.]HQA78571.1 hypothetical protein [Propionicimonas sp.]HQD98077.1 hypothetical protein [Propionicimonas sp.]